MNNAKRRMKRIFHKGSGRCLIVAIDHAGYMDAPSEPLKDPAARIREVRAGGADSIITTYGTACSCVDAIGDAGLILTHSTSMNTVPGFVETALRLGADGIKHMVYPWLDTDPDAVTRNSFLAIECAKWGLPLLSEMIPGGFSAGPDMRTPERIAGAARVGAENGADMIKTFYTGDSVSFKVVVENSPVPVVILGGDSTNDRALLQAVRGALDAGGAGVAMGRNIWGHPAPEAVTAAIAAIVHDDASVEDALRVLR
ncbi:MAG: hypothetical protein HC888_03140 [Candidatus Competibacteraceae bacterium]|nr:hypothetical protein [Candidatus Competibacteraceae bacterium]